MFGPPSLSKILILVLIVVAVWGAFKVIGRLQEARREERRVSRPAPRARVADVQEMVRCASCGAYVAPGTPHECGQSRRAG